MAAQFQYESSKRNAENQWQASTTYNSMHDQVTTARRSAQSGHKQQAVDTNSVILHERICGSDGLNYNLTVDAPKYGYYPVRQGDTIQSIGRELIRTRGQHTATAAEINNFVNETKALNHLSSEGLQPGRQLAIRYPYEGLPPNIYVKVLAHPAAAPYISGKEHNYAQPTIFWQRYDMPESLSWLKSAMDQTQIGNAVVNNESGRKKFESFSANDNGAGISAGDLQYNQIKGQLDVLLHAWNQKDPQKFAAIFGPHAHNLLDNNWLHSVNISKNPALLADLRPRFQRAQRDLEFQSVQLRLRDEEIAHSSKIAIRYGITSKQGMGTVADKINQYGEGKVTGILSNTPQNWSESQKLARLIELTRYAQGADQRLSNLMRALQ